MTIQDGYYDCRATGRVEYGYTSGQSESIAVEIEVLEGDKSLGKQLVYFVFTGGAIDISIEKLRALGWSCDDLSKLTGLGTVQARCQAKTEPDRDGKPRQRWGIVTGTGKAFRQEMTDREKERFAARFRNLAGGKTTPADKGPPPGRFDDPIPF